jgi:hypothetical protein
MKRTRALVRLEKKLASDSCAILDASEIRLLDREVRQVLIASFPGMETYLDRLELSCRLGLLDETPQRRATRIREGRHGT